MPELPDVEALRRYLLGQNIVGLRIDGVEFRWPRAIREPPPEVFKKTIKGRRIQELERRAKFLLFRLNKGTLILHLRMTGSLVLASQNEAPHSMVRNIFRLSDGRALWFYDPRKLGQMWLVQDESAILSGLGSEPMDKEFTPQVLAGILEGRSIPIKVLLCEQSAIAGIGNIYADEVLFEAGISPTRRAASLAQAEIQRLHAAIVTVLPQATEKLSRILPVGAPPTESPQGMVLLQVPREEGAPCTHCSNSMRRQVIRGRSAYFCPRCQK